MKFYSETLDEVFDTVEDLEEAEHALQLKKDKEQALKEARAERAKEVETAMKEANEAAAHARELLNDFVRDYKSFHYSYHSTSDDNKNISTSMLDFLKQMF